MKFPVQIYKNAGGMIIIHIKGIAYLIVRKWYKIEVIQSI